MEATAVEIGLSLSEYYNLTPRRFFNIRDRYIDREIRHARQANVISVLFANANRDQEAKPEPFKLDDFAPALRNEVAESGPQAAPFDGPEFLRPCAECGTPKWKGHLPGCQTGQRQFQGLLDKTTRATERMHQQAADAGKPILVPRRGTS
jgi:hypothetical protein